MMHGPIDRPTDDSLTDGPIDRQTVDRWPNYRQIHQQTDGLTDGPTLRLLVRQMDEKADVQMNKCKEGCLKPQN